MTKRAFDLLVSTIALMLLSPILVLIAASIKIFLGSPVLFRQKRPGLNGRIFELIKFRTMTAEIDSAGELLPDERRMTRFGRWLRSSSLDELPELWNIVTGDMSLVGPRPLLPEYLDVYSDEQNRRHEVRPGITGWAQVNGRNALTWEQKFEMDVWYVDNKSFWLDLHIIVMTFREVLFRRGISHESEATMSKFTGSDRQRQADSE